MVLPLYFTDSTVPVSAADALVSGIIPTDKTVIAERTPAIIFFKMLVFFIVFTPFVVLVVLTVEFAFVVNNFFIADSPFGLCLFP